LTTAAGAPPTDTVSLNGDSDSSTDAAPAAPRHEAASEAADCQSADLASRSGSSMSGTT
jgi:hypothetical protein